MAAEEPLDSPGEIGAGPCSMRPTLVTSEDCPSVLSGWESVDLARCSGTVVAAAVDRGETRAEQESHELEIEDSFLCPSDLAKLSSECYDPQKMDSQCSDPSSFPSLEVIDHFQHLGTYSLGCSLRSD